MSEENMELNLDQLDAVFGGIKMSGGVTYKRAKNCPACGTALAWVRNSTKTQCMQCHTVVEAEKFSGNPFYEG